MNILNILVTNVYSYKNKGDAAIVLSLLREIKRAFPDADVLVQTADVKHDKDVYGAPVTSSLLWTLLSAVREKPILTRIAVPAWGIFSLSLYLCLHRLFGGGAVFWLPRELRVFVRENQRADLAIACGGGYLRTANSGVRESILLFVTCLNFLTAHYVGKRVYLYSQSIGPVHGRLQRAILRFSLDRVNIIEPREDISVDFLGKLQPRATIVPTADPALLLGGTGTPPTAVKLQKGRMHVGITVRKWFKDPAQLDAYMQAVAATIDYLIEQHQAQVFYIPQVIAENFGDDDRKIAQKVWKLTKNQSDFVVIDQDLHPYEIIGLCGKMHLFMGTRMHSNIFALINHVPVVAIEYEHKTRGIMRGLNLEKLTIDIQDVTPQRLQELVDDVLKHRQTYVDLIKKHLPEQIQQSQKAIEVIKKDYEQTV